MISDMLGWDFIQEGRLNRPRARTLDDYEEKYLKHCADPDTYHSALQAPQISHFCHNTPKDTAVVFMMRDPAEINASDKHRISHYQRRNARAGKMEPSKSVFDDKRFVYSRKFLDRAPLSLEDTPQAVYDVWHTIQKRHDFSYHELPYKWLQQHHLWLPLNLRRSMFTKGDQLEV
jgi:hypothetical protein